MSKTMYWASDASTPTSHVCDTETLFCGCVVENKPKKMSALDGAERKGRNAFIDGKTDNDCPYPDRRTDRGAVTWSRAFRTAWFDGFEEAQKASAITQYYTDMERIPVALR